jgi:uncharacterized protein (TIGR02996 family)
MIVAVYFVYRSDELSDPTARYLRRFEDRTILDWFRRHWRPIADYTTAQKHVERLFGIEVCLFGEVFEAIHERGLPRPTTIEDVQAVLQASEPGTICSEQHCIQVLVDADVGDSVYYFFDDVFVEQHPELTVYLLHDWRLPDGLGSPRWKSDQKAIEKQKPTLRRKGEGRIYASTQAHVDRVFYANLKPSGVELIDGLRVPGLCRQLMVMSEDEVIGCWSYPFKSLRKALFTADLAANAEELAFVEALRAEPDEEVTWRAYADWLMERGQPGPGVRLMERAMSRMYGLHGGSPGPYGISGDDPTRNIVHVGEHFAQACIDGGGQWYVFDDLWGSAHPVLANALLRYLTRWDVLSTGDEQRE